MSVLLATHLFALGIWFGCVFVEALFEFMGSRDEALYRPIATLHAWTDAVVEVPALTVALVAGIMMLGDVELTGLFIVKIVCGLLAMLVNALCLIPIYRRRRAAKANDVEGMKKESKLVYTAFAVGFIPGIVALTIGIHTLVR